MENLKVLKTNTSYFFNDCDEAEVFIIADEIGLVKAAVNMGGVWFEIKDPGFIEEIEQQIEKDGFREMYLIVEDGQYSPDLKLYQNLIDSRNTLPKITTK
jgi:hypothetical protein